MRRSFQKLLVGCMLLASAGGGCMRPGKLELPHRWVYVSTNMLVAKNVESTIALLQRAAEAGYTGVALADSKFMRWDRMPPRYLANVGKVRAACRKYKLDCTACVMPMGYSNSLLSRDPNLAAGLPVTDAPFVVRAGKLVPEDEPSSFFEGSFELYFDNRPVGWVFADQPGKITFIDTQVKYEGKASLRMQDVGVHSPRHGHGRVMRVLHVAPFRHYHVSAAVKTQDFAAADKVKIIVLAEDQTVLNTSQPPVRPTQDWKLVHITFNSLEFSQVRLYLGVWGGKGGKIWWDDVRVEPAGLFNMVRREGAPLRVTSADGKIVYAEGRDFAGAKVLGTKARPQVAYAWRTPPQMTVPRGSRLREGQKVLVSYYHTAVIHRSQVTCCMSEPKVYEILKWQVEQVHKHVRPDGYFMQHDEIRVQGWDESCQRRGLTPGEILADNARRCVEIITKEDPGKPIYVWSDMFDPHHNAGEAGRYYLVRGEGPWYGSWKGLPKEVTIINWHRHQPGRLDSLKHFAARGHKQILAGYYDEAPERIADWLADAAKVDGVVGVMYTTWKLNYDDLETFAEAVEKFVSSRRARGTPR